MRGTTGVILEHQRILRLPRKMTLQHFKEISRKQLKRHFQCGADPRMIRATSEQETVRRNPPRNRGDFSRSPRAFSIEKIQHFALRLSFQISPNTAPATKSDSSTSSHMKCHLQCAEQPVSSSNITEYCACHAKWLS